MKNRNVYRLAQYLLLGFVFVTGIASAHDLVEGRDYRLIQPVQQTDSPGKIEVLEFFSYACPHCAQLNPLVQQWSAKQPAGVVFKQVPVQFARASWTKLAQLHYALDAVGELSRLEDAVFIALHKEGENLSVPAALNEWLVKKNVNIQKFNDAYNSFGVASQVKRADQMTAAYKIDGVPNLTINGIYAVNNELPHEQQLKIADALIAKLRASGKTKK
jgi:protein dithiol oxidoreductase (disulfide-forming)